MGLSGHTVQSIKGPGGTEPLHYNHFSKSERYLIPFDVSITGGNSSLQMLHDIKVKGKWLSVRSQPVDKAQQLCQSFIFNSLIK